MAQLGDGFRKLFCDFKHYYHSLDQGVTMLPHNRKSSTGNFCLHSEHCRLDTSGVSNVKSEPCIIAGPDEKKAGVRARPLVLLCQQLKDQMNIKFRDLQITIDASVIALIATVIFKIT